MAFKEHRYCGSEVFILELAPDALLRPSRRMIYVHEKGALPLHLACYNADCPETIVKLLLERNPSAAEQEWEGF